MAKKESTRTSEHSTSQPKGVDDSQVFDYIIVGSGAGGAPLAARLAQSGKRVLVLEAGSNQGASKPHDAANEVTRVPSLHAVSTEHDSIAWRFFVEHYASQGGSLADGIEADTKLHRHNEEAGEDATHDGILYPRASTIGGCTVHNAMITIAGPDSDWDDLADYLGDDSWRSGAMRTYFQRIECNEYIPRPHVVHRSSWLTRWYHVKHSFKWLWGRDSDTNGGMHGFDGWLHTSLTDVALGLQDKQLIKMLKAALLQAKKAGLEGAWSWARTFLRGSFRQSLDPNHARTQSASPEGVVLVPLSIHGPKTTIHQNSASPYEMRGRRSSPRELLMQTLANYPNNLTIWTDCLVTKVILEDVEGEAPRAVGVEYLKGKRLYKAHVPAKKDERSDAVDDPVKEGAIRVDSGGEVILCGGTFNTPQLLMLSGIGDPKKLKKVGEKKESIRCRVALPGVGRNLQDRYEVSVVGQMKEDFSLLDGATYQLPDDPERPDRHLRQWREEGTGLYTSNGAVLGMFKRSHRELAQPDLFIFGVPAAFRGYHVGYSKVEAHNLFSWVILKSHTKNQDGYVRLRSTDPRDTPLINFQYFNTGTRPDQSANDPDLLALLHGVKFVRGIFQKAGKSVASEVQPGSHVRSDSSLKDWIRRETWGHHACGTCRMGPDGDDDMAVLDSQFRVRKCQGLRVVDASIFPKIPGYFIVTNIYMASEKAAEVILASQRDDRPNRESYPREFQASEAWALGKRRDGVQLKAAPAAGKAGDKSSKPSATGKEPKNLGSPLRGGQWKDDVAGLALSGGGIRSATLSLGVLQGLARQHLLRRIDFLSTVSGGGYIGSCIGRFFDRLREDSEANKNPGNAADRVEQELTNPHSRVIDWLRKHGNYIAPHGGGDGRLNLAVFIRNLLSVHLVVGLLLLAAFGIANALRYGAFDNGFAAANLIIQPSDLPIGHLVASLLGAFFSPWFVVVELILLFLVLPRITAYWIVSQDHHGSFKGIPLFILFFLATILLYMGVYDGLQWEPLLLALALLSSFIHVELAWCRGDKREQAVGIGNLETQRLRTRNYLTYDLGLGLALAGGALVFALIDTLAHGLHQWIVVGTMSYVQAFASLGATIIAITPLARRLAGAFSKDQPGPPSTIARILRRDTMAGTLAVVFFSLPMIFYCFAAHAVYQGGSAYWIGIAVTLLAVVLSLLFALPSAVVFVNRSSLAQTYSARLARAYLGASNPLRHRADGIDITEVIPGDDVASIRDYRPHEASGPLHLINTTVNQTLDFGSRLRKRDRKGENMAVSCLSMTVGQNSHSLWNDPSQTGDCSRRKVPSRLEPIGRRPGTPHPLVDQLNQPADKAEMLSLRQWVGISGAAVSPGRGSGTSLGTSLLMGLVNLRTGHWWDSGITSLQRRALPELTFLRRLIHLIPSIFTTQRLILFEWLARFPGPWDRYWHIADGGFFDNTGGYELIRRRVPRMIICDGGADPRYQFEDLAELVRKVRIDFGARIVSFTSDELDRSVPATIRQWVGTESDMHPPFSGDGRTTGPSKTHAALFWVHYPDEPSRRSVLLFIKSSVTGDEPTDIQTYHAKHLEFPHEGTADQFFDEAQWESYRKLGEHVSDQLFAAGDWLWQIPLTASEKVSP